MLYSLHPLNIRNVKQKWERGLDGPFTEDNWLEAIASVKNIFVCNRMRETQYKILHRSHITPFILNKMDNQLSALCIQCNSSFGTYIQCLSPP